MSRLYVLDGNGIGHWLFHSTRIDEAGNELALGDATRAWFARFSMAMAPSHMVVAFDGPNNWRFKEYVEYKASRIAKPKDEEKIAALKTLPPLWDELGVAVICREGFEADDIMAAIATKVAGPDCEVVIVSSDKDLMQLVCPSVRQYDPRPNKAGECVYYDERAVEEKLRVPPHRVVELLALMGDASDNVPGVEGWGAVRAATAIRQTLSERELFRKAATCSLEKIEARHQTALIERRADYEMSKRLVSLRCDVEVPTELSAYAIVSRKPEAA